MVAAACEQQNIKRPLLSNSNYLLGWLISFLLLLISGMVYRTVVTHLEDSLSLPVTLPVSLAVFPTQIGEWTGEDVSIPENVIRIAGNDDYIYRIYRNRQTGHWVNVYVAYSGRPRTMVGHRPDVCYGAAGWICEVTIHSEFQSSDLDPVPCLIHRFRKPGPGGTEIVVLNYYILNGQITNNEDGFSGLGWRTPNISGDPARYVAQVQISASLESQVRLAAARMTDLICDFLPDQNGFVKAASYNTVTMVQPAVVHKIKR